MQIHSCSASDQAFFGATHKVVVDYSDVAGLGASASGTLAIYPGSSTTFPAGTEVTLCAVKLITAFDFSDSGINSLTVKVGDGDSDERYLAASGTQLAVDGTEKFYYDAATAVPHVYLAADTVDAIFTAANGGSPLLSECTSGKVEFFLRVKQQNELLEK